MEKQLFRLIVCSVLLILVGFCSGSFYISTMASTSLVNSERPLSQPTQIPTPVFRFPIVYDAPISSLFDHEDNDEEIYFYDGRVSQSGYVFTCDGLAQYGAAKSWVGCTDPNGNSVSTCARQDEMWYDNHQGIDFEYYSNWHNGTDECDLSQWDSANSIGTFPIYAPAAGLVTQVDSQGLGANGAFIKIEHDINGNYDGNDISGFSDDKFRSVYLHLKRHLSIGILVNEGLVVSEGQLLGYGHSTGASWTPHLHFEVQRTNTEGFPSGAVIWTNDPFGWESTAPDPWLAFSGSNELLWDYADGDLSCDGRTNAIDALFILQYNIGQKASQYTACPLQTLPSNPDLRFVHIAGCDVNRDTKCDTVDALLIMQCDVSIRNVFCPE